MGSQIWAFNKHENPWTRRIKFVHFSVNTDIHNALIKGCVSTDAIKHAVVAMFDRCFLCSKKIDN